MISFKINKNIFIFLGILCSILTFGIFSVIETKNNGYIGKVYIPSYVNKNGNLINSHSLFFIVKYPELKY